MLSLVDLANDDRLARALMSRPALDPLFPMTQIGSIEFDHRKHTENTHKGVNRQSGCQVGWYPHNQLIFRANKPAIWLQSDGWRKIICTRMNDIDVTMLGGFCHNIKDQ